jgi:hypothetical protein
MHFDQNNVKRINFVKALLGILEWTTILTYDEHQSLHILDILEASGYQPYLISPEKPLKFPIKGVK